MRVDKEYLYFDTNITIYTKKKMTGHSFVALAGYDSFNKPGDAVLSLLKFYKSQVDPKYLWRGDYAEMLVRAYYKKVLKRPFVFYDEDAKKKNNYDFFPEYKQCGGIPDLEMVDISETIEVKGKSMKDYEKIAVNKDMPLQEKFQGLFYGFLRKNERVTMAYVFFDEESENLLFEGKKPITNKNIKLYTETFNCHDFADELKNSIKKGLNYYNKCIMEHRIPLIDISPKVLQEVMGQ